MSTKMVWLFYNSLVMIDFALSLTGSIAVDFTRFPLSFFLFFLSSFFFIYFSLSILSFFLWFVPSFVL